MWSKSTNNNETMHSSAMIQPDLNYIFIALKFLKWEYVGAGLSLAAHFKSNRKKTVYGTQYNMQEVKYNLNFELSLSGFRRVP